MKKNRFGASGVYYAAEMTARGLIFEADTSSFAGEEDEEEEEDE